MAAMAFDLGVKEAVDAVQAAFAEFGERAFPRAVQFALNKVVIQGVKDFRDHGMPIALRHSTAFTRKGPWYELDRSNLAAVTSVDQVVSAAFILPMQSTWLKYGLGEEKRLPGDVGIEGIFQDQTQLYLPHERGLENVGIRPNAQGNFKGVDIKRIGKMMAEGYRASGGARFAGVFEIKAGDRDPARLGVGIHSRPMRGLAVQQRERTKSWVRRGKGPAPTASFTRRSGVSVTVPKVVNMAVPELLFLTRKDATYKPNLMPEWERSMKMASERIGDILEEELILKMEHALSKARRRR